MPPDDVSPWEPYTEMPDPDEREGLPWAPPLIIPLDDEPLSSEPEPAAAKAVIHEGQEYLSPQQVGHLVGLHPRVIQRAVNEGDLPAFKLRGKIRIRRADLDAWIAANQVEPYSVPDFDGD